MHVVHKRDPGEYTANANRGFSLGEERVARQEMKGDLWLFYCMRCYTVGCFFEQKLKICFLLGVIYKCTHVSE